MKRAKTNIGGKKQRSGAWSESKWTNQNHLNLFHLEIDRVVSRYSREIERTNRLAILAEHPHPDFVSPVKRHHIIETIRSIPDEFTLGLKSIIVTKGSRRIAEMRKGLVYGTYWSDMIFLFPYPKQKMTKTFRRPPPPHILSEYKRAGATVETLEGSTIVAFTEATLREFYLRDVLIHEIGHHVDAVNFSQKTERKIEGFAEWFATEHGFRRRTKK